MEIRNIIETTRVFISQGEPGEALQILLGFVKNDPRYKDTRRTLELMEFNFNATRQQERKGIMPASEAQRFYSKMSDELLSMADELEAGRVPSATSKASKTTMRNLLTGGVVLLILGIVAVLLLNQPAAPECPTFADTPRRILLLPFQQVSGDKADAEVYIQQAIRKLSEKNMFPISVEIFPSSNAHLSNPDEATVRRLGKDCQAAMVIWGFYEKSMDTITIQPRFLFAEDNGPGRSADILTVRRIADLQHTEKFRKLEDAVFSLCAFIVMRDSVGLSKKWLEKIKEPNAAEKALLSEIQK